MSERRGGARDTSPAVTSKKKVGRPKGSVNTDKATKAGQDNLQKGRKKREEMRAAATGIPAKERWAKLLDGSLKVEDLDNDEIARMTVRSADGSFAGKRRAVPSHLAQQFQKEGIKRATELFRLAAPRAVARLLEIADDPDVKDADAIRALDIVLNRGLGKMPETVLIEEKSRWDESQEAAFGGVDRDEMAAEDG